MPLKHAQFVLNAIPTQGCNSFHVIMNAQVKVLEFYAESNLQSESKEKVRKRRASVAPRAAKAETPFSLTWLFPSQV